MHKKKFLNGRVIYKNMKKKYRHDPMAAIHATKRRILAQYLNAREQDIPNLFKQLQIVRRDKASYNSMVLTFGGSFLIGFFASMCFDLLKGASSESVIDMLINYLAFALFFAIGFSFVSSLFIYLAKKYLYSNYDLFIVSDERDIIEQCLQELIKKQTAKPAGKQIVKVSVHMRKNKHRRGKLC